MGSDLLEVRVRGGLDAAMAVGRVHGLPLEDLRVLSNRGNLLVHFAPAPVVARVATLTAWTRREPLAWLAREVAVAGFAARRGAAVIPPAELVDPGPHRHNGFGVSLWAYRPCSPQRPDAAVLGESLARLHLALDDYPGTLPFLTPVRDQIEDGLAALERENVLEPGEVGVLRARHEAVKAELDDFGGSNAVLHGDSHAGNLLLTDGAWWWTDLEETCVGPREWDLAVMIDSVGIDATAALRAYATTAGEPERTRAELAPFLRARELEAAVWAAGMAHQHPARYRDLAREILARVTRP
ncbi:phosphotransferase [Saccharopolyspora sp. NPDC050389]|uniref:phosphotransferase enzyme family protein n=1 Tax=Saccharopolyspora sp. NPDC050389 TaxID=3155516 RepID=UPI0033D2A529